MILVLKQICNLFNNTNDFIVYTHDFDAIRTRFLHARQQDISRIQRTIKLPNLSNVVIKKVYNSDVQTLKQMLEQREVTSVQLLDIFVVRCLKAGVELKGMFQFSYDRALELAKECDRKRKEEPDACKGEFFGIPISIKENVIFKGTSSCGGTLAPLLNGESKEDGLYAMVLLKMGAIPFVTSSVSQMMMSMENDNKILGMAQNPWDRSRNPGASSGGEGILVSTQSSPFGIGTDLGGSVRIPAAFCGIYGFKPTVGRIPHKGFYVTHPLIGGNICVRSTSGPMGKSVADLAHFMSGICTPSIYADIPVNKRDHNFIAKPFEWEVYNSTQKLRIGYYKSFKFCESTVTTQRAVEEAVAALKQLGHEVVEVELPNVVRLFELAVQWSANGGSEPYKRALQGEDVIEDYCSKQSSSRVWKQLQLNWIKIFGESPNLSHSTFLEHGKAMTSVEYRQLIADLALEREKLLNWWEAQKLSVIVCPIYGGLQAPQGMSKHIIGQISYSCMYNLVNLPGGVVPVTLVREDEQYYKGVVVGNFTGNVMQEVSKNSKGLPIAVQVVAPPFQEEICLRVMREIDSIIQFKEKPQYVKNLDLELEKEIGE